MPTIDDPDFSARLTHLHFDSEHCRAPLAAGNGCTTTGGKRKKDSSSGSKGTMVVPGVVGAIAAVVYLAIWSGLIDLRVSSTSPTLMAPCSFM
jgi:hypothetical protein